MVLTVKIQFLRHRWPSQDRRGHPQPAVAMTVAAATAAVMAARAPQLPAPVLITTALLRGTAKSGLGGTRYRCGRMSSSWDS